MGLRSLASALLVFAFCFSSAPMTTSAWADNEGLDKLDQATELKLGASSPADLGKVIELCEEALELGLDDGNAALANQVLAASALQRAQMLWQQLPRIANNADAVRRLQSRTMEDLEKAVKANPKLPEAFILMAKIEALIATDRDAAKAHLTKAIELLEDKPIDLSNAYIMRAQLQESDNGKLEDLAKAIEADSTNSDAWQARVLLQMGTGRLQEAVEDAQKILETDADNLFAIGAAVQSLLQLKKPNEAIELLSNCIERAPDKEAFYRERARAYRMKSFDEGLSEEEQEAARDAAMADLNKTLEMNNRDAEALVMRGEIYYEMGEDDKANRDISDSLLINPDSWRGIWMRSVVAAREGRLPNAIADMEILVRAMPDNTDWIMQLASYYQMDDRPRLAIRLLDKLIELEPEDWRAQRLRGDAKLSIGEHKSALADYEEAITKLETMRSKGSTDSEAVSPAESDLDYSGLLNNLAWVLATSPNDDLRDGERSVELGLKACEVSNYEAAHILSTLAAGYAEVGDFEKARKWAAKAVELGEQEDDETNQLDQLKQELESYKAEKPWREEQKVEENSAPLKPASETIDT